MDHFLHPAFPALALAHFLALLSPGQDFFIIVGHSIRHGLKSSLLICLGIAFGNGVYIILAILGWQGINSHSILYMAIKIAGAFYLLWIGYNLIRTHKRKLTFSEQPNQAPSSMRKPFVLGVQSSLLNPKNALFYISILSTILGPDSTGLHLTVSAIWMVSVVFFWDLLISATLANRMLQKRLEEKIHIIETVSGIFLVSIAVSLFFFF
ncbi:MAG: LysE family translocator [Methylocystaceae bacterium]|nr:LysE family translocator [Methylocystaceae bacterium]